jgi:hypothetical protein
LDVNQIARYVETMANEKHKLIIEHYYRLNDKEKLSGEKLQKNLN